MKLHANICKNPPKQLPKSPVKMQDLKAMKDIGIRPKYDVKYIKILTEKNLLSNEARGVLQDMINKKLTQQKTHYQLI